MSIAVIDFGSQYSQLVTRRIRELQVYGELFPWDTTRDQIEKIRPGGFILSGGPASVYEMKAPRIPGFILESGKPILGICYGMQALTQALGGKVEPAKEREYGYANIQIIAKNPLLPYKDLRVWMSHGDRIETLPPEFIVLAKSKNSPIAAMSNLQKKWYGVQFHPEVKHTPLGSEILQNFVVDICQQSGDWTPDSIIEQAIEKIRKQSREKRTLVAVSGGVDSTVAATLAHRALGNQLTAIFVDHGFLRLGEREQVEEALRKVLGANLLVIDARNKFMSALSGIVDPERKRSIIGELFIRTFEQQAARLGKFANLIQGTIYPDVIESRAPERDKAARIKTHHNVGGMPSDHSFNVIEPLRYLCKDEVRKIGEALGLPSSLVWRQPFPGPGLAIRCVGPLTPERISRLKAADDIFIQELTRKSFLGKADHPEGQNINQAFAVLLPVQSVGVMGDQRTYMETIVLRAVSTSDFMTADWVKIPHSLLARVSNRIVNEVQGINRVVYDITSKPPATIEWE